jgi:hypothetical protein
MKTIIFICLLFLCSCLPELCPETNQPHKFSNWKNSYSQAARIRHCKSCLKIETKEIDYEVS